MNLGLTVAVILTMEAYHITQWHPLYERSETRKTDYMSWYAKQTKLVGIGIGLTLAHKDALKLLGLWTLIETLASQSALADRGWLVRNRRPLDAEDMHGLIPSVAAADFQMALDWFSGERVNWLERRAYSPTVLPPAGKSPGTSPTVLPPASGARELTGRNSATDRQTDSTQTDRQTDRVQRERESVAGIAASRTQAGVLLAQIRELEGRKASLTAEQRAELRKKRRMLAAVQEKQAAGNFASVEVGQ